MNNIQDNYDRIVYVRGESELRIVKRGDEAPSGAIDVLTGKPSQTFEVVMQQLEGFPEPVEVFVAKRVTKSKSVITENLFPVAAESNSVIKAYLHDKDDSDRLNIPKVVVGSKDIRIVRSAGLD
ncbi:MAG: hypothetical protein AAGI27_03595 [Pseudomonadota bacterium]